MSGRFEVAVAAGVLRSVNAGAVSFPHRWTAEGVTVETEFTRASTGITYSIQVASPAPPESIRLLLAAVDEVAEIPRALRAGADVTREQGVTCGDG
jgi:hypothetical protein